MTHPTTLAVIDVLHIFRASWAATSDKELSAAYDYTMRAVKKIAWSGRFVHTIVCCDAPPYKRAEFYPEYKANREKPDHQMVAQIKRLMASMREMGLKVVRVQGYEADDCIATIVGHAEAAGWLTTIYSADKDLMQLVSDKTTMVSTRTGEVYDIEGVIKKRGVHPKDIVTQLALEGDPSDNIPGAPKIGQKTATKLINEYGSLEDILAADISGAVGATLKAHQHQVLLSAVLVELDRKVPLVWGDLIDNPQKVTGRARDEVRGETKMSDEEREAIQQEPSSGEVPVAPPVEPIAREPEPEAAPAPAGDRLVGGALALQDAAAPEPAPRPGLAKAELDPSEGIELRPGLTMTRGQFQMLRQMAHYFFKGGLYRRKFDSEEAIFTVLELGLELGLSPQITLGNFDVIEGRPAPGAHFLIARASEDPGCEYLEMIEENFECEDPYVTYETKSRASGRVKQFTYRWSDATKADMTKKHTWKTRPREMLRKTGGSQAARLWYPGACAGLYSQEELGMMSDEMGTAA